MYYNKGVFIIWNLLIAFKISRGGATPQKSTCRFIIGTSTSGWTVDNCDYLCDGTDDDVEIQAALDALPDTGGEILILDGTYNISASIKINKNYIYFRGSGNSILKKNFAATNNTQSIISVTSNTYDISGFCLDGNKDLYKETYSYCISIKASNYSYASEILIHNNLFLNIKNGIYISGSTFGIEICNNSFKGAHGYDSGTYSIYGDSFNYAFIHDNFFDRMTYGIFCKSVENSTIISNKFYVVSYPIYITTNITDASDVYFNSARYLYISNNHFRAPIYIVGVKDLEISNNFCSSGYSYGIYIKYCADVSISGNFVGGAESLSNYNAYYGISIINCIQINVSNNSVYIPIERANQNTLDTHPSPAYLIYLSESNYCLITGNYLSYNEHTPSSKDYTLYLSKSKNNFITGNYFYKKNYTDVNGTDNEFVNNKFIT